MKNYYSLLLILTINNLYIIKKLNIKFLFYREIVKNNFTNDIFENLFKMKNLEYM